MTHHQRARPRVYFWPDGGRPITEDSRGGRVDLSHIVEAFTTQKSIGNPVGSWTVTLAPSLARGSMRQAAYSDLEGMLARPNSVMSIGFDRPGGIMVGLVDTANRSRMWSGGVVGDSITVTGSDFGKALVNDHIVSFLTVAKDQPNLIDALNKVAPGSTLLQRILTDFAPLRHDGTRNFSQATIREVAEWVIRTVTSMRVPVLGGTGGSGRLGDYITVYVPDNWNDGRIQNVDLWSYQGTIWGFLQSIVDADFYELYIDSVSMPLLQQRTAQVTVIEEDLTTTSSAIQTFSQVVGQSSGVDEALPPVGICIRPKPFDEPSMEFLPTKTRPALTWEGLRTAGTRPHHDIPLSAVLRETMGVSDAEVYSYYRVTSTYDIFGNPQNAQEGMFFPSVDLFALQRYGLRAFEGSLTLLGANVAEKEALSAEYTRSLIDDTFDFRNRLHNWYRLNAFLESGSITVVGRDEYRIGDPVMLRWKHPMRGLRESGRGVPGVRYYCPSTSHQWSFGDHYTTTLALTRGHNQSVIEQARRDIDAEADRLQIPGMQVAVGAG